MSSWAALTQRAHLAAGETVLVNGATGTAGRLAVQIAKHMGARKVMATGRNPTALEKLGVIGADVTIPLAQPREDLEAAFKREFASEGIDVVLDYLWGRSAEVVLVAAAKAGKDGRPIRFVQVGGSSGSDVTLPSAVLRSSALELMGSGLGSIPLEGLVGATREMLQAAVPGHFQIEADGSVGGYRKSLEKCRWSPANGICNHVAQSRSSPDSCQQNSGNAKSKDRQAPRADGKRFTTTLSPGLKGVPWTDIKR